MMKTISSDDPTEGPKEPKWQSSKIRPLTTDERASFLILSLYMLAFCFCTFVYWEGLVLRIFGVTVATGGLVLFIAAFFNTEAREQSHSRHPLQSYVFSLFITLFSLFTIRFVAGIIPHPTAALVALYSGVIAALVIFRKALVQIVTLMILVTFIVITISNWHDVLLGHMKFKNTMRQCGYTLFQIGPIQDVANMMLAGNYMGYLSRIDYRNEQINILAIQTVAKSNDNELKKTQAILDFVSNEIFYVSDPDDGLEFAKRPTITLLAGGGDCDDQTILLCSMLESVGLKTYIAFTDDHVFALVQFKHRSSSLKMEPFLYINGIPCDALDAADPGATIGRCATSPLRVKRVFDVREKAPVRFSLTPKGNPPHADS